MVIIQVMRKSTGKPAQGIRVSIAFEGFFRGSAGPIYTDERGLAIFQQNDPGTGEVYVDGNRLYKGRIEGQLPLFI